jgi:2,3-diketo-5-methylthio-1-phosphopentane phosphatase
MSKTFKIFLDFDGTISTADIGDELFRKFGHQELTDKIINDLLEDKITSRKCWLQLCESIGPINKAEWDSFIDTFGIDPGFHSFVEYCNDTDIDIFILSDGFDYYIERILSREKLNQIKVFSNELSISGKGFLIPSFPYFNEHCKRSANCKHTHIIQNSGDIDYTFFVGDGNSDRDSIEYVDFIFAKNDLLKHCEKERITYFPYNDFFDVIKKLKQLQSKKRLKKRHQAELKRREAYLIE